MTIVNSIYFNNKKEILGENIDKAWKDYRNTLKSQTERLNAQSFLVYALNISSTKNINEQIIKLMMERDLHKEKNPEYIPGLSPRHLKLKPEEMRPLKTETPKVSIEPAIKKLFEKEELVDVNKDDKYKDARYKTPFFDSKKRAEYRMHIYKGQFYANGKLFDTSNSIAHEKMRYAAFTFNVNGELSVFNHNGTQGEPFHSTMNSGCPLVCAGELIIEQGKLLAINTYSGHYRPTLFNVYRTLQYFMDKDIDLSSTYIYTDDNPKNTNINIDENRIEFLKISGQKYYKFPASELMKSIKNVLINAMNSIEIDTKAYKHISFKNIMFFIKDIFLNSSLTKTRHNLSVELLVAAADLKPMVSGYDEYNKEVISKLLAKLYELKKRNISLSKAHGKDEDSGRLHKKMNAFIEQVEALDTLELITEDQFQSLQKIF